VLCRDSRRAEDEAVVDALTSLHYATRPGEPGDEQPSGLLGATLALLRSRAPDTVSFADVRAATGADADDLCEALRDGFLAELVMPHRSALQSVRVADVERPVASPLARWQARQSNDITSLAYTTVHMEEPAARMLLRLLDGTRDRAEIRAEFREQSGVDLMPEILDANLDALARLFLLTDR
jgi:hypothetical protein